MKKKLEADLISIAHRILKLKNKSELVQLHQETQKLFEKLSVLRFVEENFGDVKPTIGLAEIKSKLETIFDTPAETLEVQANDSILEIEVPSETVAEVPTEKLEEVQESPEAVEEEISADIPEPNEVVAEEMEEEIVLLQPEKEIVSQSTAIETHETAFKPSFELAFDSQGEEATEEEVEEEPEAIEEQIEETQEQIAEEIKFEPKEEVKEEVKSKTSQISFDDLLGANYADPVFITPEELEIEKAKYKANESKLMSLNDSLSKGITIGLNDRIAFIKHLFANSSEDYNRVLSQLITFDTFQEAEAFINDMVKPDYHNWEGKEEYVTRFMDVVEKRFS
ncbi:hypothetical protein [Flavobacterium psychrotolerans]|uniref:Uncharacterized protein n=1 Tax=Flavobacterium psychrotolerans TaxID=2169410 RepID=A0A2U1JHX6_9FLAO|nr:hypothetical protein [Flavobacterium psychrotolerans]PWA04518.1 hypothetical protein DB895_10535 [Flavobacterium psychrotolerans]